MPQTDVRLYRTTDGRVPVLQWLEALPEKAQRKCLARIVRLQGLGHEIRRPEADFLREGIWELRAKHRNDQYRILYFFHGTEAIVLSHGIQKNQRRVKDAEIGRAKRRRQRFLKNPEAHSASMEGIEQ